MTDEILVRIKNLLVSILFMLAAIWVGILGLLWK